MEGETAKIEEENSETADTKEPENEPIDSPDDVGSIEAIREPQLEETAAESESELLRRATAEQLEQLEKVERDYCYQLDKNPEEPTAEHEGSVPSAEDAIVESVPEKDEKTTAESAANPEEKAEPITTPEKSESPEDAENCPIPPTGSESLDEVARHKPDESAKDEIVSSTVGSEANPTEQTGDTSLTADDVLPMSEEKSTDNSDLEARQEMTPTKKKEDDQAQIDAPSLMDIISTLSPEKLEEIKAQVLALSKSPEKKASTSVEKETTKQAPQCEAMEVDVDATIETLEKQQEKSDSPAGSNQDDCIILLDSDEDDDPGTSNDKPETLEAAEFESEENGDSPEIKENMRIAENPKHKLEEDKENKPGKILKQSKECVNPDCSKKCENFQEAPRFVLAFFYAQPKNFKTQFACDDCFDEAISTFEKMGEAMFNNESIADVKIPPKQEMVEIIDSDEEEERHAVTVPDEHKILFDEDLEKEVESILEGLCTKIDFRKQSQSIKDNFTLRISELERENAEMVEELKRLERSSLKMYNELYSINKPKMQRRPSIDADADNLGGKNQALKSILLANPQQRVQKILPKQLPLQPPNTPPAQFDFNEKFYYAIRTRGEVKMHWAACRLLETKTNAEGKKTFKVEFVDGDHDKIAEIPGKDLALNTVNEHLKVGARVVARFFTKAKNGRVQRGRFLPGVVGENMRAYNDHRYLIFCDYGQVQYVSAADVREIAESSKNVWDDVHVNLRQFIQDYLQSKISRQRPLLNVRLNQRVPTERNGKWHSNAIVQGVDASLVKMFFPNENVYEWLYRGSKRLGPLYSQGQRDNLNARRNDPSISFITIDDDETVKADGVEEVKKNIAKKSTAPSVVANNAGRAMAPPTPAVTTPAAQAPVKAAHVLNDSFYYLDEPKDVMKKRSFTPRKDIFAKKYVKHTCGPKCLERNVTLPSHTPLSKPLLTCWERQIIRQKTNRWIVYKAPCGRVLRNLDEIHRFLKISNSVLNVDNFDLDVNLQVLSTCDVIDPKECPLYIPDMTEGKEGMKIPIVNAYDDVAPPKLEYSEKRIPQPGVNINTDPAFMACCDCTDDCSDKSKCACFQLTIRGFQFANRAEGYDDINVSYTWKRLHHQVTTGIYECHSGCSCSKRCLNRVVQHPISVKMLLFRTPRKGWGLQSCHDIPKGSFICIYAGYLYREDDANALCQNQEHGDEYFAELDLIETAAPLKEGYEAGVRMDSDTDDEEKDSDSDYNNDNDDGDEEFKSTAKSGSRDIVTRSGRNKKPSNDGTDDANSDSDSDEMVHMEPATGRTIEETQFRGARGLRRLYGKNEKVFIMDARTCGNVGRYFNHSCDPNMIVQSVFVDTHDMRFPWIAFFSSRIIKAGEELTWNYNYLVGSVPTKVLYCHCGSKKCNGRIL